jgi:hypothetical protein
LIFVFNSFRSIITYVLDVILDSLYVPSLQNNFHESDAQIYQRFASNIHSAMLHSVQDTTFRTYSTGWNSWKLFMDRFHFTDYFLLHEPLLWSGIKNIYPSYEFKSSMLSTYVTYIHYECDLAPSTARSYLTGIKHFISAQGYNTNYFDDVMIHRIKSACLLSYYKHHNKAESKIYPFNVNLIVYCRDSLLNLNDSCDMALLTALELAFSCLLRISEYQQTDSCHELLTDNVTFIISNLTGLESRINAKYISNYSINQINAVVIRISDAKNDKYGESTTLYFAKTLLPFDTRSFDLVSQMYNWCRIASPEFGTPFLYYHGLKSFSTEKLNKLIKLAAIKNNLDPNHFSTKSLRIGGATALAIDPASMILIQKIGRWKSLTFLQYINISVELCNVAAKSLFNPDLVTIKHLQTMYDTSMIHVPSPKSINTIIP